MINRGEREEFVKLFFLKDYWEERLMSPFAHFVLYILCQWRSADFPGDPTLNTDVSETLWWMESVLWAFLCSIWKLSAPRAAREGLKQGQGRGWGVYSEKGEIRGEITGLWVSDESGFICYIYICFYITDEENTSSNTVRSAAAVTVISIYTTEPSVLYLLWLLISWSCSLKKIGK